METFTPEFTAFWLNDVEASGEPRGAEASTGQPALSQSQQQLALEELAERVNAARTVL